MKKSYFQNLQFCDVGFLHRLQNNTQKLKKAKKMKKIQWKSVKNGIFSRSFFHFFLFFKVLRIILKPDVGILHRKIRKIVNFENLIFSWLLFKNENYIF